MCVCVCMCVCVRECGSVSECMRVFVSSFFRMSDMSSECNVAQSPCIQALCAFMNEAGEGRGGGVVHYKGRVVPSERSLTGGLLLKTGYC